MTKITIFNCYTMIHYGGKIYAIIATIEIGQAGHIVAPLAAKFTDATLMNLLTLNLLIYDITKLIFQQSFF